MKNLKLAAIAVLFSLVFSSCSSEETLLPENQSNALLKTYQLNRDANGVYSIDLNVDTNVSVNKIKNTVNNTNEFYLFESGSKVAQKTNSNSDLWFDNESFKIEFNSENFNKASSITVFDNNIKFAEKTNTILLANYKILKNENGTFDLDFKVKNGVIVDFVYNEKLGTHEIHLEKGKGKVRNFSRTFEKEDGELLKIDFVNHLSNSKAKGDAILLTRKPKVIISNGEDDD